MAEALLEREHTVFVGGKWKTGRGSERLEVIDPSSGGVLARVQAGGAEDVEKAAQAAGRAFDGWKRSTGAARAQYLRGFARGLKSRKNILVRVQMHNNGKPRLEAEIDVDDAIACFDYYATLAEGLDGRQDMRVDHAGGTHFGLVRHEPVGPVGMIVPWNFPLVTSAWKIAPALAAGCTAVMKTSEMTPLNELVYGDIATEIGLPAGVLNIVTGGADVGVALTRAPELRKISFTGSNMIGAKVMAAVSGRCLPVSLELGGKSPIIVTADADIDQAVSCIMGGVFFNAGQMCSATSRLIVDKSIEPRLIEALVDKTRALKVGSPFEDGTEMGPLTTAAQCHKVLWMIAEAKSDGLDCLTGGGAIDRDGHFVKPTIFRDVPHAHSIWRDEIFGPVLATTTVSSDEEAIAVANDTDYGLVGSVVSVDWSRGKAIADRIEAGQIWINTPQIVYPDSAWGGFKQSGIGRELGPWGLSGYQGVKHILSET
ncbi:aldehyde dehydrogenase family protein [Paracoccus sp. Z330]|uniref:aldehyde dehydrogenase (NAD(+)) n=1 Tax=Paracoccus onchidii TaxID=3017813 RepID=A0ABT4ZD51_9RHOB|nr:aldehyde dehydrogenase family protein [Paracoccus onchidii]MDB6177296.1 aldehyde dehydrogenase family protein [Paracoccus onchidii]